MGRLERLRQQLRDLEARCESERSELLGLADSTEDLTDEQEARWAELTARFEARDGKAVWADEDKIEELRGQIAQLEAVERGFARGNVEPPAAAPETRASGLQFTQRPAQDDVWNVDVRSLSGDSVRLRDAAMRTVENTLYTDEDRQAVARTLHKVGDTGGTLKRHIVASSRPAYISAFRKYISRGHEMHLTADELRAVEEVRALSLTDAAGGYGVPFTLDPTIIDTGTHLVNPWRQIASVIQTTTDNWQGIASTGITAYMWAEATEAIDSSPTFTQPSIVPKRAQAWVPFSVELEQDFGGDLQAQLREMFAVAKDDLEDAQFAVGSGSGNNVQGIVTGLVAASATTPSVTTDTFAIGDLYKVEAAVQARVRQRAVWVMNHASFNSTRAFDTAGGAGLWARLGERQPDMLMGYPTYESASIDGVINASAENYVAVFGDIRSSYRIIDRLGLTVEYVPHVFGSSNVFPTGQRGLFMFWRFGAGVVNAAVAKVLNVT